MEIDKSELKDKMGRPLTQGLFLEIGYDTKFAVYTLKDDDFMYEGKLYPSLKRLYLDMEDPIEYDFANKYLLGWNHWKRICENKIFTDRIEGWREELQLKLRARGFKEMMNKASTSPMAAKWLTDKGWEEKKVGRPSKSDQEAQKKFEKKVNEEFKADILRLKKG